MGTDEAFEMKVLTLMLRRAFEELGIAPLGGRVRAPVIDALGRLAPVAPPCIGVKK